MYFSLPYPSLPRMMLVGMEFLASSCETLAKVSGGGDPRRLWLHHTSGNNAKLPRTRIAEGLFHVTASGFRRERLVG